MENRVKPISILSGDSNCALALKFLGAPDEILSQYPGLTVRQAWEEGTFPDSLMYLAAIFSGQYGWPGRGDVVRLLLKFCEPLTAVGGEPEKCVALVKRWLENGAGNGEAFEADEGLNALAAPWVAAIEDWTRIAEARRAIGHIAMAAGSWSSVEFARNAFRCVYCVMIRQPDLLADEMAVRNRMCAAIRERIKPEFTS